MFWGFGAAGRALHPVLLQKASAFGMVMGAPAEPSEKRHGGVEREKEEHSLQSGAVRDAFKIEIGLSLRTGNQPGQVTRAAAEKFSIVCKKSEQEHDAAGKKTGEQRAEHGGAVS